MHYTFNLLKYVRTSYLDAKQIGNTIFLIYRTINNWNNLSAHHKEQKFDRVKFFVVIFKGKVL